MALATRREDVEAAYLLTGAELGVWETGLCHELFDANIHSVENLLAARFQTGSRRLVWDLLLEGGNDYYPDEVPSQIETAEVGRAGVSLGEDLWEVRMVEVKPLGEEAIQLIGGWPNGDRPSDARRPLLGPKSI